MEGQSYEALDARLKALENQMGELTGHIEELLAVLNQFKGVISAFKLLFYITAPVVAAVIWIKQHVSV